MKTFDNTEFLTLPGEGIVMVGGNSRARYDGIKFDGSEIDDGEIDGGKVGDEVGKKDQGMSKSTKRVRSLDFFIFEAELVFIEWRQVVKRLLVPDLVTCYSRHAQRKWMKLRRSC